LKERGGSRLSYREMIAWIEQLREWQRELPQTADEFVEAVKGDIFQEQIFVFTPKGEVKDLPRGSTPLDMAYRIHTDIGDHCAGARIITNMADTGRLVTRLVPLDYELQGGEIVDIVVNRATHPTRDWLAFARTAAARSKIRRYLKTYEREINLQLGRERLDFALKTVGTAGIGVVHDDDFVSFTTMKKYPTQEDVYVALGREDLPVEAVMEQLVPVLRNRGDMAPMQQEEMEGEQNGGETTGTVGTTETMPTSLSAMIDSKSGTRSPALVKLAHCCCPLPGDAIVGLFNPGKGITVHRSDCRTLRRSSPARSTSPRESEQDRERLVEVNWLQIEPQVYLAPITIVARDRAGLLRDVAAVVADFGINMTAVTSSTNASSQKAVITAILEIETVEQVERVFKRLQQVKNVVSVTRTLPRTTAISRSLE
jgi:GTP pyrophosphokinase